MIVSLKNLNEFSATYKPKTGLDEGREKVYQELTALDREIKKTKMDCKSLKDENESITKGEEYAIERLIVYNRKLEEFINRKQELD